MSRIVVNFSCGAASAVAAKIVCTAYAATREVAIIYCDTSQDEHPDNMRFLADVERWIGQPVTRLKNPKYDSIDDVFRDVGYIVGPTGASCTKRMKRDIGARFLRDDDTVVLGYTADEPHRIHAFNVRNPDRATLWVLALAGITKADCYKIVTAAGVVLPAMYRLGYNNNNCIGCVKGGQGYWNKIRRDFPEVFARRAAVEREVGTKILKVVSLDQLDPNAGRDVPEPDIECGMFCSSYADFALHAEKVLAGEVNQ